jgi:hypothetical protein
VYDLLHSRPGKPFTIVATMYAIEPRPIRTMNDVGVSYCLERISAWGLRSILSIMLVAPEGCGCPRIP